MRLRINGTRLWAEDIQPGERASRVSVVTDEQGAELGIVEYVGIKLRSGAGTAYGWRPLHSGWTASQLKTRRDAVAKLRRAEVTAPTTDVSDSRKGR